MKKLFTFLFLGLSTIAVAQETYEDANLAAADLNGTARYVAMGGAMDALGADISTIGTNPAGIGLFRTSTVNLSGGFVSQPGGGDTKVSLDQVGFVYALKSTPNSFFNVGFNYHKSKNFNQILSAADRLQNASLNKLTYIKGAEGYLFDDNGNDYITSTRLDELIANTVLWEEDAQAYLYKNATGYLFDRKHKGYIGDYDFNLSGNIHDRWYWGVTLGIHDVHYKATTNYSEALEPNGLNLDEMNVFDERRISGVGIDAKLGVIWRPVETSPFRIGLSLATPTFYDLESESYTQIGRERVSSYYKFKLNTPWKLGLSLGHTFGTNFAIGAVYEYADYSHIDNRINDGWDGWEDYSHKDRDMNAHTKETLKGVSTIKLGAEYKVTPAFALRAGYNYVSPLFDKNAAKGAFANGNLVESYGIYFSSTADYTNWQDTHRFTCGAGYAHRNWTIDLAYQYSQTDGEYHPFMNYYSADAAMNNIANNVDVSNKRHQLLCTVGYKF